MFESKIFKNENILLPEYLPNILPHRESQIQLIADNLKPAARGRKPQNMFIFGGPGIGKTASIKFVFRQFEEYSDRVKTIYINTWDYNTSSALLAKLSIGLGFFVQRRGLSKDEIMEKLIEALRKTKKSVIICLDEIDQLIQKDEKALYDLLRINQYVQIPVGLVMISNYKDIFVKLEPRIRSSLNTEEVEFKSYSLEEMKDILKERVKYAFQTGVLEPGVLLVSANHAVQRGGDVRIGLECLMKSGRIAERTDNKLRVKHVKEVIKEVKSIKREIIKEKLSPIEKRIIELLKEKKDITSTELNEEYNRLFDKISQPTFRKQIIHLEKCNMITVRKTRKDTRGRKYIINLAKRKSFK